MLQIKREITQTFTLGKTFSILLGTAIVSFGIHNIHSRVGISEGGIIGLLLLCSHWFGISASILSPVLDGICYLFGYKYLGRDFLKTSIFATISLAGFYRLWELFPPILPNMENMPLLAAVIGGLFVGVGCGLVVRQGASSGGDDALALVISKLTGCKVARAYLATDMTVLLLSLSYIPFKRIAFSLLTVTISSFLIDFIASYGRDAGDEEDDDDDFGGEAVPD